jgi:hypothetical protein
VGGDFFSSVDQYQLGGSVEGGASFFCNEVGGKLRLYMAGKLKASLSFPVPPFHQPFGLVAKASLWLPFDVEMELASVSNKMLVKSAFGCSEMASEFAKTAYEIAVEAEQAAL